MNKYSSKAIKTAATVGMSLAMVLSNVAPVMAAEITGAKTYCITSDVAMGKDLVNAIKADIKADATLKTTIDKIKTTDTVANWSRTEQVAGLTTGDLNSKKLEEVLEHASVKDYITNLTLCSGDSTEKDLALRLVGKGTDTGVYKNFTARVTDLEAKIVTLYTNYKDGGTYDGKDLATSDYEGANGQKALYDALVDLGGLKGNTADGNQGPLGGATYKATYEDLFSRLESAIKDYEVTYVSEFADDFVRGLEAYTFFNGDPEEVTVRELVEKDAKFHRSNLSTLEDFVKDVKDGDIKFNGVKYDTVKEDTKVADYIDALDEMIEEIKEANALFKTTEAKDIKKASGLSDLADKAVAYKADPKNTTKEDAYFTAFNAVRSDSISILQTYVEDFLNEFFTVKAIKRSNGNYTLELANGTYGRYVNEADTDFNQDVIKLLKTNVEAATDESVYEALTEGVTDLETLIKAVTTDIEGLTLSTNLTSAEAAKIVKAQKAMLDLLDTDGPYYSAMTSKERRAVKANETLVDALYKKLIYTGNVTQSGWINKGNGEWDYIAEDGSRPTKWVASGANWYYVKNGTMLRNSWIASDAQGTRWYYVDDAGVMVSNTTVNGYTFNSYGVWVK